MFNYVALSLFPHKSVFSGVLLVLYNVFYFMYDS